MDRPLSALELTALGVILKRGPCLAHAVVLEFANSQTFAYRSGAGSIYPLLKRLTAIGLLACERKRYSLTEAGAQALRDWLRPPFDVSTNLDVLRSRAYFLKLLSPEDLSTFVGFCSERLLALLDQCKDDCESYHRMGDLFSEMAMRGAVRETEARLAWLRELGEHFGAFHRDGIS